MVARAQAFYYAINQHTGDWQRLSAVAFRKRKAMAKINGLIVSKLTLGICNLHLIDSVEHTLRSSTHRVCPDKLCYYTDELTNADAKYELMKLNKRKNK